MTVANRSRRRILRGVAAASVLAAPFVRAQRGRIARVVIADAAPKDARDDIRDTLAREGFVEGRNLRLEQVVIGGAPPELAESRARELVASRPDVIFMMFAAETVLLQHLTREIPIVFFHCMFDPVRVGLVASSARPGANVTGTYFDYLPLIVKRWALFREVQPSLERGGWVGGIEPPRWKNRDAAAAYAKGFLWQEREATAMARRELGIRIDEIVIPGNSTEEQVVAAIRRLRPEAVRLSGIGEFAADGPLERFLVSERILSELVVRAGADTPETWPMAIAMIVRILRGERPATIPVFQGTRYNVRANPALAKRMGIVLPPSILLQAHVIEG